MAKKAEGKATAPRRTAGKDTSAIVPRHKPESTLSIPVPKQGPSKRARNAPRVCPICEEESVFPPGLDGCAADVYLASQLCPGEAFLVVADKRANDPTFRGVYDKAKQFFIQEDMSVRTFNPPTSVTGQTEYSTMIYYEVGVLSESEFVRIVGLHPKDLKHPSVTVTNEESHPMTAYLVSLRDFPAEELPSLRKLRIARAVQVQMEEHFLDSENLVSDSQGMNWLQFALDAQCQARPAGTRTTSRNSLSSVDQLRFKAQDIIDQRQQKEEEMRRRAENHDDMEMEDQDALNALMDDEQHESEAAGAASSAAASSGLLGASLGTLGASVATSTTASNKRKRGKRPDAGKTGVVDDGASSAGAIAAIQGQEASEFQIQLQRTDPEMALVCARHESIRGTTATCLGKLSVANFLAGHKLGQALTGAAKVCTTLLEKEKKEAMVLQERINLCTAAQQMAVPILSTLSGAAVKGNIVMLKDYHHAMPFEIRCAATSHLLLVKLKEICSSLEPSAESVVDWVQCLQLGGQSPPDGRVEIENLDVKFPTFRDLVREVESQTIFETSDGGLFAAAPESQQEAGDEDFFASVKLPSATEPNASTGIAEEGSRHPQDETRNWQVLTLHFAEVLQDDNIIGLLNCIAIEQKRLVLVALCKNFLELWKTKEMTAVLQRLQLYGELPSLFLGHLSTFQKFCSAVATMIQVRGCTPDPDAISFFTGYKGPGIFEKAVQAILTRDVDAQQKKLEGVVQSREQIHVMIRDAMRTAASSKIQQPKFDALMQRLEAENPEFSALQDAWEQLESFRTGLRDGAVKPMEELMIKVAKAKADMLLSSPEGKMPFSSRNLNVLLAVLKQFPREAGVIDLQTQVMKWARGHNDALAASEVEALLDDFINANKEQAGKRGTFTPMDTNRVRDAVGKCNNKLPTGLGLEAKVHACTFLYLQSALDHVDNTTNPDVGKSISEAHLCMKSLFKLTSHPHMKLIIFQLDLVKATWALKASRAALESLGHDAGTIVANDLQGKGLQAFEKGRQEVRALLLNLDEYFALSVPTRRLEQTEASDVTDMDMDTAFFNLRMDLITKNVFSSDLLEDVVSFASSQLISLLDNGKENLLELGALGFEGTSWKQDLAHDADEKAVLSASEKIAKGGGVNLRSNLEKFSQETIQTAVKFVESLATFAEKDGKQGNAKLKQLGKVIAECQGVVKSCAVLFLEMGLATAISKGMRAWKIKDDKIKGAVANVDVMLSTNYETVKEEEGLVHPVLLKIAREAVQP